MHDVGPSLYLFRLARLLGNVRRCVSEQNLMYSSFQYGLCDYVRIEFRVTAAPKTILSFEEDFR